MFFRFLAGAGIGGEYAAINSAIDELIPARNRGHTDLAINGTWWLGSAAGALLTLLLLNPVIFPESVGWRLCFVFGAVLGVALGIALGVALGDALGVVLGVALGNPLGDELGAALGEVLGPALGDLLGAELGLELGDVLG